RAVVVDAGDSYASAGALIDQGFATPVAAERGLDRLPAVVADAAVPPPPTTEPEAVAIVPQPKGSGSLVDSTGFALLLLVVGLLPLVALPRRVMATRTTPRSGRHDQDDSVPPGPH